MSSFTAFALWYPPERLSTMNGLAFAVGSLGAITATVPLELLLRVWDWREAFLLIVGVNLTVSLLLWFWVPERSARGGGETLSSQFRELVGVVRDPAFARLALCACASQGVIVSLQSLWIATWLRDVAGYAPANVARGLFFVNLAMFAGYMVLGRAADAMHRRGRSALPLLAGGVAVANLCLGLIVLGVHAAPMVLWCLFFLFGTAIVLGYPTLTRRYPKAMAGRANTAINVSVFVGMFTCQWAIGLMLDLWPRTATGYAPEAYTWALGVVWALQLAGLIWLWSGRKLLDPKPV
jgi:predicted MFS family arabinose efflux permease